MLSVLKIIDIIAGITVQDRCSTADALYQFTGEPRHCHLIGESVHDGKIRLPFSAVKGLGGAAAQGLMDAREEGPFISCDDLQARSGITKAVVQSLRDLGAIDGLPETSQMTFF